MKSLLKKIVSFVSAPPYHIGTVDENRSGLQKRRIQQALTNFKEILSDDERVNSVVGELRENGVVLIPNYLSEEDFDTLKKYIEQRKANSQYVFYKGKDNSTVDWTQFAFDENDEFINKHFCHNDFILKVVETYTSRKIIKAPELIYQELHLPEGLEDQDDLNTVLHADRYYPTIKVFFSFNEHTKANGAFVYCKKSQKMDDARILAEEDLAIREALVKEGRQLEISPDELERGRNKISTFHLKNFSEESMVCKPNTLIFADVSGYHKRGKILKGNETRITLRMIFHYVHSPKWVQYIFSRLKVKTSRYLN